MAFAAPSGSNTYIPSHEASDVVVDYTRNSKAFKISQYAKFIPVSKDQGYYLALNPDEQSRIVSEADYAWEDGASASQSDETKQEHEYRPFRTMRRNFPYRLGYKAVEQATWNIHAQHAKIVANKAMTLRTIKATELLFNPNNWAGNTADADDATLGGTGATAWSTSTASQAFIQKTLMSAAERIDYATNGAFSDIDDQILLISPKMAIKIRSSPEFHEYLKGSPDAYASLNGSLAKSNGNFKYGLPPTLYGFNLIVENTTRITSRRGATVTKVRCVPDNAVCILTRTSGVQTDLDAPADFSTLAFRFFEEMTVETKDDPDNRRHLGRCVEDWVVTLQAALSGYLITGIQ